MSTPLHDGRLCRCAVRDSKHPPQRSFPVLPPPPPHTVHRHRDHVCECVCATVTDICASSSSCVAGPRSFLLDGAYLMEQRATNARVAEKGGILIERTILIAAFGLPALDQERDPPKSRAGKGGFACLPAPRIKGLPYEYQ